MAGTKVENLKIWRQRMIGVLPKAARDELREANEKSADQFMETIRRILPVGEPERGHLLATLSKRAGDPEFGGLGVIVSLGDAAHPYPLHLEAGHKAADGSHVPPKPFWNPAKRLVSKTHRGRAQRALTKAVKKTMESL